MRTAHQGYSQNKMDDEHLMLLSKKQKTTPSYQPDILGADYQQMTLDFPSDYEGKVIATLVRKKAEQETHKAVLYIHGFIDYFFQTEMADQFNHHGYDFYALDLRKYGRSHLSHQHWYNVRSLSEYDAEISAALEQIATEEHDSVILAGHSTGGLITTLYVAHHPNHPLIRGLWCNSPFYDFNMSEIEKKFGIPRLSQLGKLLPEMKFPSRLNPFYVPSLHKQYHGEWLFNLEWKKPRYPKVRLSFVRAIHEAQKEIHASVHLGVPTLIMHASQSSYPRQWNEIAQRTDVILDVADMQKYGHHMHGDIQLCQIESGMHDLVLSAPEVRAEVYQSLFDWLNRKGL